MGGKEPASVNEKKDKKKIKKKSDGKPKRKERKAPMTPAERRASKPNFAMVTNNIFMLMCRYVKLSTVILSEVL